MKRKLLILKNIAAKRRSVRCNTDIFDKN